MQLTVRTLAHQLLLSGWPTSPRVCFIAARYYLGLETRETLNILVDRMAINGAEMEYIITNR